jgi:tetratricopeptide (TPR) repeat protein
VRLVAFLGGLAAWIGLSVAGVACAGQAQSRGPADLRHELGRKLDRGAAEEVLQTLAGRERDPAVAYFVGEALASRGLLARADSAFALAAEGTGPDRFLARARRAELRALRGERAEAVRLADRLATELEQVADQPADRWLALGIAYQVLGAERPAQFKDALAAYDRAIAADSSLVEAQLRVGQLFLAKYNAPDAKEAFAAALARDPGNPRALLGLAEVQLFAGDPGASAGVRTSLAAGPKLARSHAVLARLELDAERFDSALAHADRAVALDSSLIDGWAARAAALYLADDSAGYRRTEAAVKGWHRAPAGFYAAIGEALGRQRRYQDAARLGAEGVAVDADDADALTVLGTNLLRLGKIDSGRAVLEKGFARDPYHVWNKNTLDLLDELAKYATVERGRFLFVAAPEEVDLLALYLGPLLERAYDSLAARYRYRPPTPVRLELYHRTADFSVRTVGLAGLGALGVSFGSTLAMDAPSARPPGDFNWGSTAWHELTHAFTLGASGHRVPRWLSEGLSVLEERRARPGWGAQATASWLAAYKGGRIPPVSALNDGFVRPQYPNQVAFSYYQASLVAQWIEEIKGFDAVLAMLAAYRSGAATPKVLEQVLGMPPAEVDRRFDQWLRTRFAEPLKHVAAARDSTGGADELAATLRAGLASEKAGNLDQAIDAYLRADRMFPGMADHDAPSWLLARTYRQKGDTAKALEYLTRATRIQESNLEANKLEGELLARAGQAKDAAAAYERAIFITPYEPAIHVALAEAAAAAGDHRTAVRERQAVVALKPSDKAEAIYQLALAYKNAGDLGAARREVLKALEEAPSFERAQTLLLELRGGAR